METLSSRNPYYSIDSTLTLTQFVCSEKIKIEHQLVEVITSFEIVAKSVSSFIQILHLQDKESNTIQTYANGVFTDTLSSCNNVGILVSESNKNILESNSSKKGLFMVTFSPIDCADNATCGFSVGSIFSVMLKKDLGIPTKDDVVDPHNVLVAAGYILYSSATLFVLSLGHGVHEFVLDPEIGEFCLTEHDVVMPKKGHVYSVDEASMNTWDDVIKNYIKHKKMSEKKKQNVFRYMGSFVADVHRIIKQGGMFMYPSTKETPKGKYSVICICQPMAFIVTQAGGLATDLKVPILDLQVRDVREKTPVFLGSKIDMEDLQEFEQGCKEGLYGNTARLSH